MSNVFIKPALNPESGEPYLVRCPDRGWAPLLAEGQNVTLDEYWSRRISDGSVVLAEPSKEETPKATAKVAVEDPKPSGKSR